MDEEKHLVVICPICGKENEVVYTEIPEMRGMLEDIPGWTGYKYHCNSCDFTVSSERDPEKLIKKIEWIRKGNPWKNLLILTTGLITEKKLIGWLRDIKRP